MTNLAHSEPEVKELEEVKNLASLIKAATDPTKQNEARFKLAQKLYEIKQEKKYRKYGFKSFEAFAEQVTGLKWRTVHYLIEAYEFCKNRPEVFISLGYRKVNTLARMYERLEEVPPEELEKSIRELEGRIITDDFETERRQMTHALKEFIRRHGIDEFKEVVKNVVEQLRKEGVI